ncbi:MAG: M23 family metallopeptidase [Gammaproteobacteria bacterium]|nr:MAG: M23 family metallopeptidase [Gammaproteobacteria bacterium]
MESIKSFILLALCIYSGIAAALPKHDPVPGGLAIIEIPSPSPLPTGYYNKKRLAVVTDKDKSYFLVGIPLSANPGTDYIEIHQANGSTYKQSFVIVDKAYQEQHLTITNKRKVNPNEDDLKRIAAEREIKNRARRYWSEDTVKTDFIIPVEGRISSIFGLKRFFNEQPRAPHSGLDIAAPEGTPIKAVESGKVIETGDFFFSGNMVYIDHGQGLISLYAHMHRIDVKPGDIIEKGQIIGAVGQTGRVTGAHLHLAIIANETMIDPTLLLPELQSVETSAK